MIRWRLRCYWTCDVFRSDRAAVPQAHSSQAAALSTEEPSGSSSYCLPWAIVLSGHLWLNKLLSMVISFVGLLIRHSKWLFYLWLAPFIHESVYLSQSYISLLPLFKRKVYEPYAKISDKFDYVLSRVAPNIRISGIRPDIPFRLPDSRISGWPDIRPEKLYMVYSFFKT